MRYSSVSRASYDLIQRTKEESVVTNFIGSIGALQDNIPTMMGRRLSPKFIFEQLIDVFSLNMNGANPKYNISRPDIASQIPNIKKFVNAFVPSNQYVQRFTITGFGCYYEFWFYTIAGEHRLCMNVSYSCLEAYDYGPVELFICSTILRLMADECDTIPGDLFFHVGHSYLEAHNRTKADAITGCVVLPRMINFQLSDLLYWGGVRASKKFIPVGDEIEYTLNEQWESVNCTSISFLASDIIGRTPSG